MWVSRREMSRLLRALADWKARAERFESLFVEERDSNRRHEDGLLNRFLTARAGAYAVEERGATARPEKESETKGQLTPEQFEMREFFVESAKAHGRHEADGVAAFEAHMRGEPLPFEAEGERG